MNRKTLMTLIGLVCSIFFIIIAFTVDDSIKGILALAANAVEEHLEKADLIETFKQGLLKVVIVIFTFISTKSIMNLISCDISLKLLIFLDKVDDDNKFLYAYNSIMLD